ncbi:hypothetical protein H6P81_000784 [Aristolochia fimbriata]|uniref:Uncharacterized protein n=1 Tax=Aristolochia fimbriata TaxID=158543 RepID=A0AAV7F6D1_ARIFI|nr:hypothetical protein H6P81_000784 [Aristolochia fimbriata]
MAQGRWACTCFPRPRTLTSDITREAISIQISTAIFLPGLKPRKAKNDRGFAALPRKARDKDEISDQFSSCSVHRLDSKKLQLRRRECQTDQLSMMKKQKLLNGRRRFLFVCD